MPSRETETSRNGTLFTTEHSVYAETILGDEGGLNFRPVVRCKTWGEETDLVLRLPTLATARPNIDEQTKIVTWLDNPNNIGLRAYPLDQFEHGGFEFEVLLGAIPSTPELRLAFETKGLDLFWQGELSEIEIKRGNTRPENVIHSIAAYHSNRQPFHSERGAAEKYGTCKAFHIYRPKAIDALGNEHWVEWYVDHKTNEFVFIYDNWFLTATYPVAIDPTVGYTSIGGSTDDTNVYMLTARFVASADGDANPGTFFIYGSSDSGTVNVVGAVYADGSADPTGKARTAQSSAIGLTTTPGWRSAAITLTGITNGTGYHLTTASDFGGNLYYDSSTGTIYYAQLTFGATPPALWAGASDAGNFGGRISHYIDYTASGGGAKLHMPFVNRKVFQPIKRASVR